MKCNLKHFKKTHLFIFTAVIKRNRTNEIKERWRYLTYRRRGTFEYQPIYWSFHAGIPKYKTKTLISREFLKSISKPQAHYLLHQVCIQV